VMGVSLTGYSMPIFWWGLLLILLFSVQLGWTPVSGRIAVRGFTAMRSAPPPSPVTMCSWLRDHLQ